MKKSALLRPVGLASLILAFWLLNSGGATRRTSAFATLTVTSTADSGAGSLRDTIGAANPGDTITFNVTLPATITLTSGEIFINKNLTITGPGQASLTISGNKLSRIFDIASASSLMVSALTIANGSDATGSGGIHNNGGAVLSVTNCAFSNNSTSGSGGGITNIAGGVLQVSNCAFNNNSASSSGGAIFNDGDASITASTFTNNSATNGNGGAIFNDGTVNITASTLSNNSATSGGAVIHAGPGISLIEASTFTNNSAKSAGAISITHGTPTVVNCTLSGNSANFGGGIEINAGAPTVANCTLSANSAANLGGGIFVSVNVTLSLQNTIIAHSALGGDCVNQGTISPNSHNLIQDGSCSPMLSGDPKLGPLQNNGGPTLTMALLPGSPAIDLGDDSVLGPPLSLTTDQRGTGFPRRLCRHVDIGAFEATVTPTPPTVTCPANISVTNDPGQASAMVSFSATATDTCDGPITPVCKIGNTIITSPHSFPVGTTAVTCSATNSSNLTGMCGFNIMVTLLDVCIQDDHSGDTFRLSSQTGAYVYTRCKDKFTLSGTGSVRTVNSIVYLTDNRTDRKISAGFNLGQLTGRANITLIVGPGIYQPITLVQTNLHPTCVCP